MPQTPRSHYETLGVPRDATSHDIQRAYRRLALRYHPDVSPGADARARFDELTRAYEALRDPLRRLRYDRATPRARPSAGEPAARRRAPAFTSTSPRRDVPRFDDEDVEAGLAGAARQRLVMEWNVSRTPRFVFRLEWSGVRWWPW